MSRCVKESVFNRVLCVTLLAIAVTFTVILTNVFVDIDSLLMGKGRDASTATEKDTPSTSVILIKVEDTDGKDVIFDDGRFEVFGTAEARNDLTGDAKIEDEQTARTKRSLDALNKNNPKIKKLLTRRLATLLEELDSDDALTTQTIPTVVTEEQAVDPETNGLHTGNKEEDDLLRLAMHNILLDGVINHIDLNAIYAEVHNLVQCFKKIGRNTATTKSIKERENPFDEYDLLQGMANCEDLRYHNTDFVAALNNNNMNMKTKKEPKKIIIKTSVDIAMNSVENRTISGNDVKSEFQIKFNGELLNSTNEKQDGNNTLDENVASSTNSGSRSNRIDDDTNVSSNFLLPFVRQYLKKYSTNDISASSNVSEIIQNNYQSKRLKRQIKLRFNEKKQEENKTHTLKSHEKIKQKDEAEIFVEIKTHFNKRGIKGAKKNKLIKALIKKIEKAIHADLEQSEQSKKSAIVKHWNIKKRTQDPLEKITPNTHAMSLDKILSRNSIGKREVDPITKESRNVAEVFDYKGNPWRKQFRGPGFLTASKSINSAETGKVDIDYNKVLSVNGIPKRLQQPLTTDDEDSYEEITVPETYAQYTKGIQNYRFLIKNNDGTGFSIGLNQYTDGPPEPEAVKMFSSLESLINAFRQNYKPTEDTHTKEYGNSKMDSREKTHSISKRDVSREIEHANTYGQDIINNSALIYHNYQEIFDHRMKVSKERQKQNTNRSNKYTLKSKQHKESKKSPVQLPVTLDDRILQQELNPSEILDIANLLSRKRRHMEMNKITNLKTNKNRRNTYLNTKSMKRMIIYKNKRNKRQIRFISNRRDDDNVFRSSEENVFSDRAVLNEANEDTNDAIDTAMMKADYNYLKMADSPQLYNRQRVPDYFIRARAQTNKLTSHYPHIFLSEQLKYDDKNPEYFRVGQPDARTVENNEETKENGDNSNMTVKEEEKLQDFEELFHSMMPPSSKRNYKVILKFKPKSTANGTEVAGFKEVHTSINKTFNKDGMKYFTLVNVSQISKIEKINITTSTPSSKQLQLETTTELNNRRMEKEHDSMKTLLQYQKEAINTQLKNLQNENSRIDAIIARNFKTRRAVNANFQKLETPEVRTTTAGVTAEKEVTVDILTTTEVPRPRLSTEDVNNLITIAITKFQQSPIIAELTRRADKSIIIDPSTTTTATSTTTSSTTTKPDILTNIILANINLTAQVLKKIDENTDILAKFLKKIHSRKDNYKMRDYPNRRVSEHVNTYIKAPCLHHIGECIQTLDPIIEKRSIISDSKMNKNTALQPVSTGNDLLSNNQIDELRSDDTKINVTEKNLNKKFFMDANTSTETGKILSVTNLNNTNPIFQQP